MKTNKQKKLNDINKLPFVCLISKEAQALALEAYRLALTVAVMSLKLAKTKSDTVTCCSLGKEVTVHTSMVSGRSLESSASTGLGCLRLLPTGVKLSCFLWDIPSLQAGRCGPSRVLCLVTDGQLRVAVWLHHEIWIVSR